MTDCLASKIDVALCPFCDKPGPGWLTHEIKQGWRFIDTGKTWHCMPAYYYEEY